MEEVSLTVQGTAVHAEWHAPKKVKRAAILIHGFNSDLRELGELPSYLASHDIGALAVDLRGHGRSQGERGKIDLERVMDDVEAAVAWVRERIGRKPLALVGHSLGGALTLGIAARRDHFDALVVAHPVNCLMDELGAVERAAYHVIGRRAQRRISRGKPTGHLPRRPSYVDGYVDRALARQAQAEDYLQRHVFMGNYAFASTMCAADWAEHTKVPTLAIHSPWDNTVKPAHTLEVIRAIPGVQTLDHDGGHACFRDLDRGRVMEGVAQFLGDHL